MPVPLQQVRRLQFRGEEIGMGFNSESGLAVGTALEGFETEDNPVASGDEVKSSITIVTSHEALMDSLGMSFEAQGRYGFFSGGAKAEFAESSSYNSTSTFLVATCVVSSGLTRGKRFRVSADAQALLAPPRIEEFKRAFGDSFVRGLLTGGELYIVIRITSVSERTQSQLSATLHAEYNGLAAAGDFKFKFAKANEEESTKSEFAATMFQRAGVGLAIAPVVEISEAIARFKNFPAIVRDDPIAYETEVATYDTLPLPLPTPEEQEDFLFAMRDARAQKLRYIQRRNDLDFALRNPTFFEAVPAPDVLSASSEAYAKLINAVIDHAIKLSRGQMRPPRVFIPSEATPPLAEPAPIPLVRRVDVEDPIARTFARLMKSDPVAAPFFAVPDGEGLERPIPGAAGGRFVIFNSSLRIGPDGAPTFGPTAGIFSHPALGPFYVYGDIFQQYERRFRFCFGHMGFDMGYPVENQVVSTHPEFGVLHQQRFQGGVLFIEEAPVDNLGEFIPPIRPEDFFRWLGAP